MRPTFGCRRSDFISDLNSNTKRLVIIVIMSDNVVVSFG